MNFGQRLKNLRICSSLTQAQLAELLNVSKSVISYYESMERTPSADVLIKLSEAFHVSADYLLGTCSEKTIELTGLEPSDEALVLALIATLQRKTSAKKENERGNTYSE